MDGSYPGADISELRKLVGRFLKEAAEPIEDALMLVLPAGGGRFSMRLNFDVLLLLQAADSTGTRLYRDLEGSVPARTRFTVYTANTTDIMEAAESVWRLGGSESLAEFG